MRYASRIRVAVCASLPPLPRAAGSPCGYTSQRFQHLMTGNGKFQHRRASSRTAKTTAFARSHPTEPSPPRPGLAQPASTRRVLALCSHLILALMRLFCSSKPSMAAVRMSLASLGMEIPYCVKCATGSQVTDGQELQPNLTSVGPANLSRRISRYDLGLRDFQGQQVGCCFVYIRLVVSIRIILQTARRSAPQRATR